jgi:hypothetical protein
MLGSSTLRGTDSKAIEGPRDEIADEPHQHANDEQRPERKFHQARVAHLDHWADHDALQVEGAMNAAATVLPGIARTNIGSSEPPTLALFPDSAAMMPRYEPLP